jgi:signal transduction histidine kinase
LQVQFRYMRRIILISFILLLPYLSSFSRNWKKSCDSLQNLLTTELTDTGKMNIYLRLSELLIANEPGKAMEFAVQAKNLADKTGDKSGMIQSMLKQCDFYTTIGEYNTALEMAYTALDISKPDESLMGYCHNRIATIHASVNNLEECLYHNKKSLYYSSLDKDSTNIMVDIHNIGRAYSELQKYDSALYYLHLTNNYHLRHKKRPDPYSLSNIGNVYLKLEEYDSALSYHLQAYKYDLLDDQKYLIGLDKQFIATTYLKMKRYAEAREYAASSIAIARELNAYDLAIDNYQTLYTLYQAEGEYKKAFEYSLLYTEAKDTLFEKGKQSLILGLETKHRVKEQEERLKLLEKQKTLYFILTIVGVLFFVSMIIIVMLVYRRQRIYRELTRQLQLANDSKEQLLSVISHDLRGSVGTIRNASKAILEGMAEGEDARFLLKSFYPVADSTYDLLENLLTWAKCNKEKISPVITEIDLKEIVNKSLEHTRHLSLAKSIVIINTVDFCIVRADANMLLSIIRNILGNAIKFSYPDSKVLISLDKKPGLAVVSVADNGIGIESEALKKLFHTPEKIQSSGTMGERGSGLGILICKTFLESMGGRIWAESTPKKGTTIYFSLPCLN